MVRVATGRAVHRVLRVPAGGLLAAAGLLLAIPAGPAAAVGLVVSPSSAVAGAEVALRGACPDSVREPYLSATIGIEKLGRSVVVPVLEGAFASTLPLTPVEGVEPVVPGDSVAIQASCRTESGFVASAGTTKVDIVPSAGATARAVAPAAVRAPQLPVAAEPAPTATVPAPVAVAASHGAPSFAVPIVALLVAVAGTIGALAVSRRSRERAVAMVGHPASGSAPPVESAPPPPGP